MNKIDTSKLEKFQGLLYQLVGSMEEMEEYITSLVSTQQKLDLEIADLEHHLEFSELNDTEAIKFTKEMKTAVMKRREAKDTLAQSRSIFESFSKRVGGVSTIEETLKTSAKQKRKMEERRYTPRVRADLFENVKQ